MPRPLFTAAGRVADLLDEGCALLTANRRLARAVREADQQRRIASGQRVWNSSRILPLQQFWTDQWQQQVTRGALPAAPLLDAQQQLLLWQQVIDADAGAGFSLLNTRRAAALCQRAHEQLALWLIDRNAAPWRSWFGIEEDSRSFLRWAEAFEARLAETGALTPELAQRQLYDALAGDARLASMLPPIALLYPDDPPPLHRELARLAPRQSSVELPPARAAIAPLRAFGSEELELEAVARWCFERVEADPDGRYAVVLQDMEGARARLETLLRRQFGCLTSQYDSLPVNFATGFTLERVPLVRDALRALALHGHQVAVDDVVAVLQSRFLRPLALRPDRCETPLRHLRELATERVPARVLREVLDPLVEGASAPWDAGLVLDSSGSPLHRDRLPSAWLTPFRRLLAAWGWGEGSAFDSLEYQQREAWEEGLDAFAGLDAITGPLGFDEALSQLRAFIAERPFQPQTTDRALQVLGPLETTGLDFDALWLTGMSASRWPARARPNPYLPRALQRRVGMPGADASDEWRRAERRWEHWRACASYLHTSYVHTEDDAEQLASPLLQGLPVERVEAVPHMDPRWVAQRGTDLQEIPLTRTALQADERAAAGSGSALLEAQAECPFKAFAAGRLQAAPLPPASAGLLAGERGSMLHRALYQLFGEFGNREALRGATPAQRREAIAAALVEARRVLTPRRRAVLGAGAVDLEARRLASLLDAWLTLESERHEPFEVVDRESARELLLGGLPLRLRIDRLDRLDDGSLLVIDYKSGTPERIQRWLEETPSRPQLPLYALLDPPAAGITYGVLRPGELAWRGIGERAFLKGVDPAAKHVDAAGDDCAALEALRTHWRDALERLARDFVAGEAAVEPLVDACRRCGRHALCRIGDAAA